MHSQRMRLVAVARLALRELGWLGLLVPMTFLMISVPELSLPGQHSLSEQLLLAVSFSAVLGGVWIGCWTRPELSWWLSRPVGRMQWSILWLLTLLALLALGSLICVGGCLLSQLPAPALDLPALLVVSYACLAGLMAAILVEGRANATGLGLVVAFFSSFPAVVLDGGAGGLLAYVLLASYPFLFGGAVLYWWAVQAPLRSMDATRVPVGVTVVWLLASGVGLLVLK